ncbi:aldehyde dehydrogenase family protein [Nocardia terpenica]|uniref:aldehyde dehydrogenase family protein n=1 Tax=Nocardia terpenica TaxID=455432 RepID=UPI0018938678|nr:aldehyde dehydrogenase family protein [Nocardia terpenica]MBF6064731.1 aldehyde dehydrogenase family protein [Nocardia terpenica]MBF6107246.1 aldehyde dehydrogenase family protein [Nocardia terpenica]MBF6115003.1 aldehyde dehydrogenase family protein [Nocardia terpenica]MBF6122109.1 aldehyde dehydrogenase family protein [Nocardia terpenica]MBF6154492.1 aldehyde dehydrogenase family protein [Nocardia terpenica]
MNADPDLLIGGVWEHASDGGTRRIVNPADGSVVATVDEATPEDARRAVAAARAAFDDGAWAATPVTERSALLLRIADLLVRDKEELARTETLDTGKTLAESRIDIDDIVSVFRYYAGLVATQADRLIDVGDPAVLSRVVREPIGVCVLIAPWNYPLLQMSWKVAPALAAGCTMVAKPSEVTPLTTIAFARLAVEAGVPAGVLNLVQGSGAVLGEALTANPDVDFISFTGGLATGRTIARVAAEHVTKVAMELGGKNPHIVFADADWDSSVDQVLTGVFLHSGQVCSAGTRLIVEESIADDFVAELARRAERIRVGPGLDPASETGPLVSQEHRAKVEDYVALGISEGATLVTGGARPSDPALAAGSFYLPTIFDRCDRSMRIVQEETFGPILTVERFSTEDEAIRLGNDTEYGLSAGVRTSDAARGERMVRALRHGTVWLNDFGYYTAAAEWGGFKKSGNGRELGATGLAEYQELKHIWHNTAPKPAGWFKGV